MANTRLIRTNTTATNAKKGTISVWIKRARIAHEQAIISALSSSSDRWQIRFKADDTIDCELGLSGSWYSLITNRKFRDINAWYHLCLSYDTTQGTASDRASFYINGVQQTSFSTANYPPQDSLIYLFANADTQSIGCNTSDDSTFSNHFDGCMSHLHIIDGTKYAASAFGSTDATTGEWKINTSPSVTYGNNGTFILQDSNSVTDQSGQSNNFVVHDNTLTKTEDNPSNNFATMNTLGTYDGSMANGNTSVTTDQTNYRYIASTLGVNKGKWYWEVKLKTQANYMLCGITDQPSFPNSGITMLGNGTYDCAVYTGNLTAGGGNGHLYHSSTSNADNTNTPGAFMGGLGTNDIITFALDLDSATKKLYVGVGGNWANGSGSTNQTFGNASGVTIVAPSSTNTGFYFPACGDYSGTNGTFEYNFGNGYFGTTAVSSAGTNASNLGIFELDVPSGYTALCTKGLNE